MYAPRHPRPSDWRRASRSDPCPVCGRPDWCSRSADGVVSVCMRVADGAVRPTRNGGHLHRVAARSAPAVGFARGRAAVRAVPLNAGAAAGPPGPDLPMLTRQYRSAATPPHVARFAASLGISSSALERLSIGWSSDHGAWAFPMTDASARCVGIRLRLPGGRKFAVAGGREGLFVPADLPHAPQTLFVTEGPTDCAALLDLGLPAVVGRPSCSGGVGHLLGLTRRRRFPAVVIVADADEPGRRGAAALAAALAPYVPDLRTIAPPAGVKDARAWRLAGATDADVLTAAARATPRVLTVGGRRPAGVAS